MDIMKMKWKIDPDEPCQIITDEPDGGYWNVFLANACLPGDRDGHQAAADLVAEHNAHLESVLAVKTQQPKYRLYVETDFDFSLIFHGVLYAASEIDLGINDVKELDEIVLRGPFGAPEDPEKRWEWDEAMAAIRENPEEDFNNTGGNRGVLWSVRLQQRTEP